MDKATTKLSPHIKLSTSLVDLPRVGLGENACKQEILKQQHLQCSLFLHVCFPRYFQTSGHRGHELSLQGLGHWLQTHRYGCDI
eukprot:1140844-Pelagomonas_calceolata.AAC.7